jgi:hypothetical protein
MRRRIQVSRLAYGGVRSITIKFIILTDSPWFPNIDARCQRLLPRKELAGAFLRPRVSHDNQPILWATVVYGSAGSGTPWRPLLAI